MCSSDLLAGRGKGNHHDRRPSCPLSAQRSIDARRAYGLAALVLLWSEQKELMAQHIALPSGRPLHRGELAILGWSIKVIIRLESLSSGSAKTHGHQAAAWVLEGQS